MSLKEDIGGGTKAARVGSTGTLVAGGCRLRGVVFSPDGVGAASVVLRDGGASGNVILTLDGSATAGLCAVDIPGSGIAFGTDIHATLTNVAGVTAFYS